MVENTPTNIQGPNTVATPYGPYTPPGPQTPAPTPTPSQTPAPATAPVSSSAHKLQAAANAGGNLSPSAIVGVAASTPTTAQAAKVAYFTNALDVATKVAHGLSQLSPRQQMQLWDKAPDALKSLLGAAQYRPPAANEVSTPHPGLWGDITSAVGNALNPIGAVAGIAERDVRGVIGTGVKGLEDFVNAPWNLAGNWSSHALRALEQNAQQGDIRALQGGASSAWTTGSVLNIFDINHIVHAWNETANGATSFQPEALLYVQKEFGITGATLRLAKAAASGMNLQQILATVPVKQRANAYALINSNGHFNEAVQLLSDSHLSLGQSVFGGINAQQLHTIFPRASERTAQLSALAAQGVGAAGVATMALRDPGAAGGIAEDAGLIGRAGAALRGVKSAALLGSAGAMAGTSLYAAGKGITPDQALTVAPFGMQIHPLSGVLDGLAQWYLNPVQIGMMGSQTVKYENALTAMEAMKNPREVEALYSSSGQYNRFATKFISAVTTPWREGLGHDLNATKDGFAEHPNFSALYHAGIPTDNLEEMIKSHYAELLDAAKTKDPQQIGAAVGRMIGDELGTINVARGRMSHLFRDVNLLPAVTLKQDAIDHILGVARDTLGGQRVNAVKLSSREVLTNLAGEEAARQLLEEDATVTKLGRPARMMRRATTLVPTGPIDLMDVNHVAQFRRVLSYAVPSDRIDQILNLYQNIDPAMIGDRMAMVQAGILEMLRVALENGGNGAQDWLSEYENRMQYGWNEGAGWVNPLNPDGPRLNLAMTGTQLSNKIAVPEFSDVYKLMKRNGVMRVLGNGIDSQGIDHFMQRYWKPAMLLRPGFAVRVAGEELALFILQNGATSYLAARSAASITDAASAQKELQALRTAQRTLEEAAASGDVNAMNKLDAQNMAGTLLGHVPDEALSAIDTPKKMLASIYGWHSVQWMQRNIDRMAEISLSGARAMAKSLAGEELLRYAQDLADRGVLDEPGARHILAVAQHADPYNGEITNTTRGMSLITDKAGRPLNLIKDGVWRVRTHDDPMFVDRWHYALSQLARSKETRIAARAFGSGGYDGQVQEVEDFLRGRGLWNDLAVALRDQALSPKSEKARFAVEKANSAIDAHEKYLSLFPTAYQTKGGFLTLDNSARVNQMFRDWATGIVDHVNRHLFSPLDTYAESAAKAEGAAMSDEEVAAHAQANGRLFPIGAREANVPRIPYQIGEGNAPRINALGNNSAYTRIEGATGQPVVRLFMPINNSTIEEGNRLNDVATPGRFWTANYQQASNIAGEDGTVYAVDLTQTQMERLFESRGAGDLNSAWRRIYGEQHPEPGHPVSPSTTGYFEPTAKVMFGRTSDRTKNYLIDMIGQGVVPDKSLLAKIPAEAWPESVMTPDHIASLPASGLEKFTSAGFHNIVSRPLDWISRQPILLYNYALARKQAEGILAARGIMDESGDLAHEIAMENAVRQTGRFIHDPEARSQFSVINRNIAPFWFAQEQFYKRWGRLFGTYPEAYYKLKLAMAGMKNIGFVTTDSYGQPAFVYPFSPEVTRILGRLPINVGFTSEINQLNPSLSQGLAPIPAFGPVISIPTMIAGWMNPRFSGFAQFFQGPNSAPVTQQQGRTFRLLDQVLPTVIARFAEFAASEQFGSTQSGAGPALYTSSLIKAAQMMETNGHGITVADQKNPVLMQDYMNRLNNWTLSMMLARSFFGLIAPGTPNFGFANTGPSADFQALLNDGVPVFQAMAAVEKVYPHATADMVFATTTSRQDQSGTYVPATQAAGQWITDHVSLFENFPQLAVWAMPAETAKGAFSDPVYQKELNLGLRARRALYEPGNPNSWYVDYEYSKAANTYYALEQYVYAAGGAPTKADVTDAQVQLNMSQEQAQAALGLTNASTSQVKQVWDQWKQGFMKVNPLFEQYQSTKGTESAARRADVVSQLQGAIKAGALPDSPWSTHIQELMSVFDQVQQFDTSTQGKTIYSHKRSELKQALLTLGTQMSIKYPEIAPFWNGVLSKQVGVVG